ncbi:MAG: ThiF family adenylyltransferase, partial [Longimicrobiales bacterium]|nr:ThiF family adenylyltransferase [Longimicrobiales bacterium]
MDIELPFRLTLTRSVYDEIRRLLLTECGREQQLFAFLARSGSRLLVTRLFVLTDEDYEERSPYSVAWNPDFRMRVRIAQEEGRPWAVADFHSHPFSRRAAFSSIDAAEHARRFYDFKESDPACVFVRGVFGQDEGGFTLEAFQDPAEGDFDYLADGTGHLIPEIEVVGAEGIRTVRSFRAPAEADVSGAWKENFQRNAVLRTREEDRRLARAMVTVVGAGGLGAELARLIALAGVRRLAVVDPDTVGPENFNRLDWAAPLEVGRPKVACLAEHLRRHDPELVVEPVAEPFPSAAALDAMERSDLILVGVDDDRVRYDVLRWCVRHQRVALDCGTGITMTEDRCREAERSGHVWLYLPG